MKKSASLSEILNESQIKELEKNDVIINKFAEIKVIIDTLTTDKDGYYAIGDLEDSRYEVTPDDSDYIFTPNSASVQISTGL